MLLSLLPTVQISTVIIRPQSNVARIDSNYDKLSSASDFLDNLPHFGVQIYFDCNLVIMLAVRALIQLFTLIGRWIPLNTAVTGLHWKVQKRATKILPALKNLKYCDRLKACKLTLLQLRGDMIETYKIVNRKM